MEIRKNSFIYSAAILASSNVVLQILGFIYRIILTKVAGTEGLGVYRLAFLAYGIVNAVCLSGLSFAVARISAENKAVGRDSRSIVASAIKLFLMFFALVAFLIIVFNKFIAVNILGDERTEKALIAMLFALFLTGFENILKSLFLGTNSIKYMAFSEVGEQIVRIIAVSLLATLYGDTIEKVVILIMLGMFISEIYSVAFLVYHYRKNFPKKIHSSDETKKVLKLALPICLSSLVVSILSSSSSVILPQALVSAGYSQSEALSQLGIVSSIAFPLMLLPMALISSISSLIMPSVSASRAMGDDSRNRIVKALKTTGFIGLPATAALIPLARPITRLFFLTDVEERYFFCLGIVAVLLYFHVVIGSILNGMGKEKLTVTISASTEFMQLVLTFYLVPIFGIYGYIYAMIVSELFACIVASSILKSISHYKFSLIILNIEPMFTAAAVYLWVNFIYDFLLGQLGRQSLATIISAFLAYILYSLILRLWGINLYSYGKALINPKDRVKSLAFLW